MAEQQRQLLDTVTVVVEVALVRNQDQKLVMNDEDVKAAVLLTVRDAIGGKHGLGMAIAKGPLNGHATLDYKKSGIRLEGDDQ